MTSPIDSFVGVVFIADANTPPNYVKYNGRVFMCPPEYLSALGSGPGNPGKLLGIRGYHVAAGPTGHQWVMTPPFPPAVVAAFNSIPAHGWLDAGAYNTYTTIGLQLAETYGVPAADVVTALSNLYNAAKTNEATAPPTG